VLGHDSRATPRASSWGSRNTQRGVTSPAPALVRSLSFESPRQRHQQLECSVRGASTLRVDVAAGMGYCVAPRPAIFTPTRAAEGDGNNVMIWQGRAGARSRWEHPEGVASRDWPRTTYGSVRSLCSVSSTGSLNRPRSSVLHTLQAREDDTDGKAVMDEKLDRLLSSNYRALGLQRLDGEKVLMSPFAGAMDEETTSDAWSDSARKTDTETVVLSEGAAHEGATRASDGTATELGDVDEALLGSRDDEKDHEDLMRRLGAVSARFSQKAREAVAAVERYMGDAHGKAGLYGVAPPRTHRRETAAKPVRRRLQEPILEAEGDEPLTAEQHEAQAPTETESSEQVRLRHDLLSQERPSDTAACDMKNETHRWNVDVGRIVFLAAMSPFTCE